MAKKAEGKCRCGEPLKPGRSRCPAHMEQHRNNAVKYRERLAEARKCPDCVIVGCTIHFCKAHTTTSSSSSICANVSKSQRVYREKLALEGRCRCGKLVTGTGTICEACKKNLRTGMTERRRQARINGKCYRCGEPVSKPGGVMCLKHRREQSSMESERKKALYPERYQPCLICGSLQSKHYCAKHKLEVFAVEREARTISSRVNSKCPHCGIWGHAERHCAKAREERGADMVNLWGQGLSMKILALPR